MENSRFFLHIFKVDLIYLPHSECCKHKKKKKLKRKLNFLYCCNQNLSMFFFLLRQQKKTKNRVRSSWHLACLSTAFNKPNALPHVTNRWSSRWISNSWRFFLTFFLRLISSFNQSPALSLISTFLSLLLFFSFLPLLLSSTTTASVAATTNSAAIDKYFFRNNQSAKMNLIQTNTCDMNKTV